MLSPVEDALADVVEPLLVCRLASSWGTLPSGICEGARTVPHEHLHAGMSLPAATLITDDAVPYPPLPLTESPERPDPPFLTHRDHRVVGRVTLDAIYPAAHARRAFPEHLAVGLAQLPTAAQTGQYPAGPRALATPVGARMQAECRATQNCYDQTDGPRCARQRNRGPAAVQASHVRP